MNLEDAAFHRTAIIKFEKMVQDAIETKYLTQHREAGKALCASILNIEKRHQHIIERFSRYPHWNKALGRTSSKEEKDYLKNGGDTFG